MTHDAIAAREQNGLALPGDLTETSYTPPENISFEEWESIGQLLQRVERSVRWWVGDWLAFGERKYGETYAQAVEVTGYDVQSLKDMVWVSSRIEPSQRRDDLTWSHHREVAALEPDARKAWLSKAADEQMSTRELRTQVKDKKTSVTPAAPKCSRCGLPCIHCSGAQIDVPAQDERDEESLKGDWQ